MNGALLLPSGWLCCVVLIETALKKSVVMYRQRLEAGTRGDEGRGKLMLGKQRSRTLSGQVLKMPVGRLGRFPGTDMIEVLKVEQHGCIVVNNRLRVAA